MQQEGIYEVTEKEEIEELFKQYQALGGNHGVETLVNNCYELPLSKKEEKKSEK